MEQQNSQENIIPLQQVIEQNLRNGLHNLNVARKEAQENQSRNTKQALHGRGDQKFWHMLTSPIRWLIVEVMALFASFREKHGGFYTVLWYISLGIGYLLAFISLLLKIFAAIQHGDAGGFVILILFNTLLTTLWGLLYGIGIFIALALVLSLPYFIYKGIKS
jgi:hypothetical protein